MIRYNRLFAVLNAKGMKKTDLLAVMSSPTLAKLSKGEPVRTDVIDRICRFLGCQPENIMEVTAEPAPVDAEEPKAVEEYVAEKNPETPHKIKSPGAGARAERTEGMKKDEVYQALKKAYEMMMKTWREEETREPQNYDRVQGFLSGCWMAASFLNLDDLVAELENMKEECLQEKIEKDGAGRDRYVTDRPEEDEETYIVDWPEAKKADENEPAEEAEAAEASDAEEPKAVEERVAEKDGTQIESVLWERFNYHLSKFSFGGLPAVDLFEHYLFLREVGVIAEKCGFSELVEKIAEYLPEKEDE
ncbi:MAG: helix-turn-helix transcriptional regulator [Lachnospiraceae bacterium]|nr:helix-turn-helix transcriptional regulator [Lachnospiraceae bacterium]